MEIDFSFPFLIPMYQTHTKGLFNIQVNNNNIMICHKTYTFENSIMTKIHKT